MDALVAAAMMVLEKAVEEVVHLLVEGVEFESCWTSRFCF
jgi:hypothetical protein